MRPLFRTGQPHEIAFEVREVRNQQIALRIFDRTHHAFSAEALCFGERRADVGYADLKDGVAREIFSAADAAGNSTFRWCDEAVVASLRNFRRDGRGCVAFPTEQLAVIVAELLGVFADDFEMNDGQSHAPFYFDSTSAASFASAIFQPISLSLLDTPLGTPS